MRRLYLDLDGVFADFDTNLKNWNIIKDPNDKYDTEMWKQINKLDNFFYNMPMFEGSIEFYNSVKHLDPVFLTACPKSNYYEAALDKKKWIRSHICDTALILPVLGGKNKALFMHQKGDVLVDDFEKNCDSWNKEGGISIVHRNFTDTLDELGDYFEL